MKQSVTKISIFILTALIFASCNSVKRVGEYEHLLTDNSIFINDKKNNTESIKNLLYQKRNSKLFQFPFRLYIHNWAKPNSDSILDTELMDKLTVKSFSEQISADQFHNNK